MNYRNYIKIILMRFLKIIIILVSTAFFIQCKKAESKLVTTSYIDSLTTSSEIPKEITANTEEMKFWKSRIQDTGYDIVNKSKYAGTLIARFHLLGDIKDVKKADSIFKDLERNFNGKETGIYLSLISNAILQHQFNKAGDYLQKAKIIGLKNAENYATTFDVDFENGNILNADANLKKMKDESDYGYQFRKSKMAHYNGDLDSSIVFMEKAEKLALNNKNLQAIALSNVGDLYTHAGKLNKALSSYKKSIQLNNADLHSLMGIGWIALVKDANDTLATKIFKFVQSKSKSPDALYKLILVAQHKKNKAKELEYAKQFEAIVTDSIYGRMYNKYLIQLYTESLKNPIKAEAIAKEELQNRKTPQTYSWYAYTLFKNNKIEEANTIYKKYISGKPLEALELYYMGKLMQANNKGYNAKEYFKAAKENIYDLSPTIASDLELKLEE